MKATIISNMKKSLLLLPFLILLTGCEPTREAINHSLNLVENQGYTNVQQSDNNYSLCEDSDIIEVDFIATGTTGRQVEGAVCSGQNGYTIRFK